MPESQTDNYLKTGGKTGFFLFRINRGNRAMVLLMALFLQIILLPLDHSFPILSLLLQLSIIFSAVFMVADSKVHMIIGLGLGIPASIILVFQPRHEYGTMVWVAYALILGLYFHVIRLMLVQIFRAKKVTLNTIILAVCTYLMLGFLWSLLYIPLEVLDPGAFSFNVNDERTTLQDNLHYFSFVTLTTTGYGDTLPISPLARALAILEALTGVLYLAVLISRLVGSYSSDRRVCDSD